MIIKMNRKSKGKKGPVEYLLNQRVKEGTAFTLRGNPQITKSLIRAIERKHKYLSGGLMFAKEEYITKEQKNEVMDEFEKVLFTGLESNQYNILWVEHSDKGRIELNFVVPRIELNKGIDLDLYTHKRDLPIFDMWKNGINAKYTLADPNDPRRARTKSSRGRGNIVANRKTLDDTLHELVAKGHIKSRNQMIELLQQSGYKITRKSNESISVLHNDIGKKALRLKGGIYCEIFTSIGDVKSISQEREQRIREYDSKVARRENGTNRTTYQKYLQARTERHQKRYQRPTRTYKKESQAVEKRDRNHLVTTADKYNKRIKINDRVRKNIETSNSKRKERISGAREREDELFTQITYSNIQLSSSFKTTREELFRKYTKTRTSVEHNATNSTGKLDTKINKADSSNGADASRPYDLLTQVDQQFSRLKKSIGGVINVIRKLKLFNLAKEEMMSKKRPTINLTPRR